MTGNPRIWVLLGARTGDNNQALALAEALDWPFEAKQLDYNALQSLSVWLPPTAATLTAAAKAGLHPPWPDLVIAIGRRSVPVARWIRRQSDGHTKLIRIGHPRIDPAHFDLVVTTRQYPVPRGENVVLLPIAMSRFTEPCVPTAAEERFLAEAGRFRLVAVGGATKYWTLPDQRIVDAIEAPFEGKVVTVTSRRTDPALVKRLREMAGKRMRLVDGASPRFALLLERAVDVFVTGDSVSMISEAIQAGKPVAIIPIELDEKGRRKLGPRPNDSGPSARRRDLRQFWDYLIDAGLVGTLQSGPVAAPLQPEPNALAAAAVRKLLGRG